MPVHAILASAMFRALALPFACALLLAQTAPRGTEPRPQPAAYPVHGQAGPLSLAADFLVHSFSAGGQTFVAEHFLVVEVALYPPSGAAIQVSSGSFSLRLNGRKRTILPQAPGFVAADLKYPGWRREPRLEAGGSLGNAGVILGRPAPAERFPGDPTARNPLPAPPRAPAPEDPGGTEEQPPVSADVAAVESALPDGPARGPVSGYLYFAFQGKTKSIRTLELLYAGPEGDAVLRLR